MLAIDYRKATATDAGAISQLILSLANVFLSDPADPRSAPFLASLGEASITRVLADPTYCYTLAWDGRQLLGLIALRDGRHVHHLFVATAAQGQGIARTLWRRARDEALEQQPPSPFTVNSSPFAVPVYQAFGFRQEGDAQEKNGVVFVPMILPAEALLPPATTALATS
ncbi:MAG: GNAT family N-acetyltransferase [Pseudomonas sp.]|uniref:GNAT family N-acetyltransferase n=1 Tax=Pseudomonas sp. TaxID=306 RepID=UPI003392A8B2